MREYKSQEEWRNAAAVRTGWDSFEETDNPVISIGANSQYEFRGRAVLLQMIKKGENNYLGASSVRGVYNKGDEKCMLCKKRTSIDYAAITVLPPVGTPQNEVLARTDFYTVHYSCADSYTDLIDGIENPAEEENQADSDFDSDSDLGA